MQSAEEETDKKMRQIEESIKIQECLIKHFNSIYPWEIDRKIIFKALLIVLSNRYDFRYIGDLWSIQIDYDESLRLLSDFDFNVLQNEVLTDDSIIPKENLIQFKAEIKSKGLVWIIHKYDADPFPSNPHAHELENNIKLDLSTGKCYRNRKHIYTLKSKDLLNIRNKVINEKGIALPPLIL